MVAMSDLLAQSGPSQQTIEDALGVVQTIVQYAGTIAFAISAALVAGRRRMNLVGVVVFGTIVALGGATFRDVLLGLLPVSWVADPEPLLVAALASAATIPLFRMGTISVMQRYYLVRVSDAAGLALFTVLGTNIALDAGAGAVSAVVVGSISGIGGGILRDTIAERIPEVLASGHFYASAAVTGSVLNVALLETPLRASIASSIAVLYIFSVRLLSIRFGWGLPTFTVRGDEPGRAG